MRSNEIRSSSRLSGLVERYHTWPTITRQSNAEHTWQLLRIYIEVFGAPLPEVTVRIVYHDSGELRTGDPPFPFKAVNPEVKHIFDTHEGMAISDMRGGEPLPVVSQDEMRRIKACDLLEMWEHGLHERTMGNRFAIPIMHDTYAALIGLQQQMCVFDRELLERRLDATSRDKRRYLGDE